ncbi:formyltetrahydrofolate deformylase [Solitalea sp. MAHUQ-68]|uniref:Formyltetrahydrofolate deformylase n=1 Tax=Solitalea agri TaxID=2953739 RepID=A0A9X2F3P1_9SPHI|nr:formyltetrahydrofolate deformylase [Solitalea agri]MCO4293691.1 formyltetrahydrofolate deformylase [Solitalea agri]
MASKKRLYTLTLSCPDRTGIVSTVTSFIANLGGWITDASQHGDFTDHHFFMRVQILADSLKMDVDEFRERFADMAAEFEMDWQITDSEAKKRVVILVSKQDHCLYDLLYRYRSQEFEFEVPCIISNHENMRSFVEWHGIPYHCLPISAENKQHQYAEMVKLFEQHKADVIVLARYMQVLSPEICRLFPNKIINIHHSFLPSFVGAKPYHQAYERGVKMIGATCHYVTEELDQGPIIEQDVNRVDHSCSLEDMINLGKDVEKNVLSRGLRYHVEDRILVHGNKTIVFD